MSQTIDGHQPQVTQSGHIINCHGAVVCPLHMANAPESKHQAEFAQRTRIWCPPGAREMLERLMADHHLTAPRLHIAWQANSLVWEDKRSQLVAKTHWLEPLAGYGMAILMLIYFILQGGVFLLTPGQSPLMGAFAFLVAAVIYLSMIWMVIRFIIIPYRVAMRVKPFLESIYTPNTTKKPVCADAL